MRRLFQAYVLECCESYAWIEGGCQLRGDQISHKARLHWAIVGFSAIFIKIGLASD